MTGAEEPPHRPPSARDATALLLVAGVAAVALPLAFPVFFRMDDAQYLHWAASHADPLAAFAPARGTLIGVWRPIQNVVWWALYRSFGLAPLGYQIVLTACFGAALVAFYSLARELFGRAAAAVALLFHVAAFPYLYHVLFWFSDLTFVLSALLTNLALLFLLRARSARGTAIGLAAFACAVLAKEPAAVVVPAVYAGALWTRWPRLATPRRRRSLRTAAVLAISGGLFVLGNPFLHARQTALATLPAAEAVAAIARRWQFYAAHMGGGPATLAVVAAAFTALDSLLATRYPASATRSSVALLLAMGLAAATRGHPSAALALLIAALAIAVVRRHPATPAALWFVVPFAGLLTIDFTVRTYLFEPSFGLALLVGMVTTGLATTLGPPLLATRGRRLATGAAALLLLAGLASAGVRRAGTLVAAMRTVSDTRMAFADAVRFLAGAPVPGRTVISIDYADMGLDYVRDVLPLSDGEKARRQKTMEAPELGLLLRLMGRSDVTVENATAFARAPAGRSAAVLVTNNAEEAFLLGRVPGASVLYESVRGEAAARVYRIGPPA